MEVFSDFQYRVALGGGGRVNEEKELKELLSEEKGTFGAELSYALKGGGGGGGSFKKCSMMRPLQDVGRE